MGFRGKNKRDFRKRIRGSIAGTEGRWLALLLVVPIALGYVRTAEAGRLSSGAGHMCMIVDSGEVYCWGSNVYRQLGDGTTTDRLQPVRVTALSVQPVAIASGYNHNCVLTKTGAVKCWGLNQYGQLGDGTTAEVAMAIDVVGLSSDVTAIAGGRRHGCALQSGGVKCWGSNDHGQLGTGNTNASLVPVQVVGLESGVTGIAAGERTSCAILTGGEAKCWGQNYYGQLGDGTTIDAPLPTPVAGLASGVVNITPGMHGTCFVLQSGATKCSGWFLGNGDLDAFSTTPVDVLLDDDAAVVSVGLEHRCVRTMASSVACWGEGDLGQVGDGALVDRPAPVAVSTLPVGSVREIASGLFHTCALLVDGEVRCWGYGVAGLGNGRPLYRSSPVEVGMQGGDQVIKLALGSDHACALTETGEAWCWGDNKSGGLGDGTTLAHASPALVAGDLLHSDISAGKDFTCSLVTDSSAEQRAFCWGEAGRGQIGDGTFMPSTLPRQVANSEGMMALTSRENSTCATWMSPSGRNAKCWGANEYGQLGWAGGSNVATPDTPGLPVGTSAVSMGYTHACSIQSPGTVMCWGNNLYGQLGDGTTTSTQTPVTVAGIGEPVISVSAGSDQTCAVTTVGTVKCWGRMFDGSLVPLPEVVPRLESVIRSVSLGQDHACASRQDGAVRCWGHNDRGQLGDGTILDRALAVEPLGLGARVTQVVANGLGTCAVLQDGSARCWGDNTLGQLGNGERGYAATPERVSGTPLAGVVFRDGFD